MLPQITQQNYLVRPYSWIKRTLKLSHLRSVRVAAGLLITPPVLFIMQPGIWFLLVIICLILISENIVEKRKEVKQNPIYSQHFSSLYK